MLKEETKEDALALLVRLLEIQSVNGIHNELEIATYIYELFCSNHIEATLQVIDETHGNVIAYLEGKDKSHTIIWNGHLDTVAEGNRKEWNTDPFVPTMSDHETKLIARGASDMKSGLAAMISSMLFMKKKGIEPNTNICFIGTCDEEKGGLGAKRALELPVFSKADAIIIGEPTGCKLGIAQKGCLWITLTVYGKTSHSAYPTEGKNAVQYGYEVVKRLTNYLKQFSHKVLGNTTAEITMIEGGIVTNMVPDLCNITMDIRMVPNINLQIILDEIEYIGKQLEKETDGEVTISSHILNSRIPIEIELDNPLVIKWNEVLSQYKLDIDPIGIHYFTDASIFVQQHQKLPVILFGPGEPAMAHKPNECVLLEQYYQAMEVLLQTVGGNQI